MKNFINKVKLFLALPKAFDLTAKNSYDESLELLLKYKDIADKISEQIPDYYILLGEIFSELGDYNNSLCNFSKALDILGKTKYYNSDEKNYLKKYIINWLTYIDRVSNIDIENLPKNSKINDQNIRKSLKIHFPLKRRVQKR